MSYLFFLGLIIPIRDSMEKPEKFPLVLTFVMFLVACTLCSVGALGYIAFGQHVQTVALLNLPPGILPNSIQLGYAIAVLLSNALTLFPTIRIIEHALFGDLTGKHNTFVKWQKNTLRISIVIVGTLIAWLGANDLDKFISLIGSICCCKLLSRRECMLLILCFIYRSIKFNLSSTIPSSPFRYAWYNALG